MNKPVYLRQKTWEWMLDTLAGKTSAERKRAVNRPGRWLLRHGIIDRPDMFQNTVIAQEPDCGPDCLIDELAAVALSKGFDRVTTFRLGDHKPVIMTRTEIECSLRESWVFDQLN